MQATSPLGTPVDLTDPIIPINPDTTVVASVPGDQNSVGYVTGETLPAEQFGFNGQGSLIQFTSTDSARQIPVTLTYDLGTRGFDGRRHQRRDRHALGPLDRRCRHLDARRDRTPIDLTNASLHWLLSPDFEAAPVLPVTGTAGFVLAGGTDPTDTLGHVGTLGGAFLQANFTNATVTSTLAFNLNGYDWLANGTGAIAAGALFDGTYTEVLVDGRVTGSGSFTGFFTGTDRRDRRGPCVHAHRRRRSARHRLRRRGADPRQRRAADAHGRATTRRLSRTASSARPSVTTIRR